MSFNDARLSEAAALLPDLSRPNTIKIAVVDGSVAMKTATQQQIELPDADLGLLRIRRRLFAFARNRLGLKSC